MAGFDGLTDEDISSILSSIGDQSKLDDINQQLEQARRLRHADAPITVNSGGWNAPNWGGILGSVVDAYKGKKDEERLRNERDIINNRRAWDTESFWRALQQRQAAQAPVPTLPPPDPTGSYSI